MIPLLVPFEEKDEAKKLGAKWNMEAKVWEWPPHEDRSSVNQWLPRIHRHDMISPYIMPNLIPQTTWAVNIRSLIPKEKWDELRKSCYQRYSYRCEVCGVKEGYPHCHEEWEFIKNPETKKGIQRLIGLTSLCEKCHMISHLGFASVKGRLEEITAHMAEINNWSMGSARFIVDKAFEDWEEKNRYEWQPDLTFLSDKYGIIVAVSKEESKAINRQFIKDEKIAEQSEKSKTGFQRFVDHLFTGD